MTDKKKPRKPLFERLRDGLEEGIAHAKGEITLNTFKRTLEEPDIDEGPRTYEVSSGNVFFDVGLEDSTELYVHSCMTSAVFNILKKKELLENRELAAATLGLPQISNLVWEDLHALSLDQLIRCVHRLGGVLNVTIDVHDEPQEPPMHLTIRD